MLEGLMAILKMKCPNCRKGNMFSQKRMFPLKNLQKMPEQCDHCGQKMEIEPGFYYGTGYVSYGVCLVISVAFIIFYAVVFGLSFDDNSLYYYLAANTALLLILLPWILRISRVLYLYIFVKKGSLEAKIEAEKKKAEEAALSQEHVAQH